MEKVDYQYKGYMSKIKDYTNTEKPLDGFGER